MRLLPSASLSVLCAASLAAQADLPPVGARVRAFPRTPPPERVAGVVTRADAGVLTVLPDSAAAPVVLPLGTLRRLDVHGRRSAGAALGRGALVGALVGGSIAVAATSAAVVYDRRGRCRDCFIPASVVVGVGGAGLTAVTTVTGGAIGLAHRDRWTHWRLPSGTR